VLEIKPLKACSFEAALQAWNEGFHGYFVDMTLSLDGFLARLYREGLSVEHSLIAFCEGKPAGLLLNAIRLINGKKIAWNGGTGVRPKFRGRGVGKALMRATIDLYQRHEVQLALLEAITENRKAISLYEHFGYEVVDRLVFWQYDGKLDSGSFGGDQDKYPVRNVTPQHVGALPFYQQMVPWQSLWQSIARNNGEALIVTDTSGRGVGYALYKRNFDEQGKLTSIALSQSVANPDRADAEAIVSSALRYVYAPLEVECHRTTYNLSAANQTVLGLLGECGFKPFIEQVHMVLTLP
jgi:GNAT superfamily N-acetyltransferase